MNVRAAFNIHCRAGSSPTCWWRHLSLVTGHLIWFKIKCSLTGIVFFIVLPRFFVFIQGIETVTVHHKCDSKKT